MTFTLEKIKRVQPSALDTGYQSQGTVLTMFNDDEDIILETIHDLKVDYQVVLLGRMCYLRTSRLKSIRKVSETEVHFDTQTSTYKLIKE